MSSSKKTKTISSSANKTGDVEHKKLSKDQVFSRIALSAYYKSEARGYEPGHEIQDWLQAEAEIIKRQ